MSTVYKSASFTIDSPEIGGAFRIDVGFPDGYSPSAHTRWPVAYVLDGNMAFHLAALTNVRSTRDWLDSSVRPALVVAIGYPNPRDLGPLRVTDLTPEGTVEGWFADIFIPLTGEAATSGGADAFLSFIEDRLHPEICSSYRAMPEGAAIFGHSFGGLFALNAFL